jgi:hypothetical protein
MGAIFDAEARIALLFLGRDFARGKPHPGNAGRLASVLLLAERPLTSLLRKF